MSVSESGRAYDAKIGKTGLRLEGANVDLDDGEASTSVPIADLIEAIERASKRQPGVADRTFLVRDEERHHMGSTWFMEECWVRPIMGGFVTEISWSKVRGTTKHEVRTRRLLKVLRRLASTPELHDAE